MRQDGALWVIIYVARGVRQAENVEATLKRGDRAIVAGQIRYDQWNDDEGNPKLVCEFCLHYWEEGDGTPFHGVQVINVEDLERQRWLRPIFKARQVHYITISKEEFDEILAPGGQLEFLTFLQDRTGLLDE